MAANHAVVVILATAGAAGAAILVAAKEVLGAGTGNNSPPLLTYCAKARRFWCKLRSSQSPRKALVSLRILLYPDDF